MCWRTSQTEWQSYIYTQSEEEKMKEKEENKLIYTNSVWTIVWHSLSYYTIPHSKVESNGRHNGVVTLLSGWTNIFEMNSTHTPKSVSTPKTPCIFNLNTTRVRFMLHCPIHFEVAKAEHGMKYSMEDTIPCYRTLFLKSTFDNFTMHEFVRWSRSTVLDHQSVSSFFSFSLWLFRKRKIIMKWMFTYRKMCVCN